MSPFCLLLAIVYVVNCDPRAADYEAVFSRLPLSHVQQLAEIEIWDAREGLSDYLARKVWLPARPRNRIYIATHELAHVLIANPDSATQVKFAARFWPDGQPTPGVSDHARRTFESDRYWAAGLPPAERNPLHAESEDLADTYAALFDSPDLGSDRQRWLCDELPELAC